MKTILDLVLNPNDTDNKIDNPAKTRSSRFPSQNYFSSNVDENSLTKLRPGTIIACKSLKSGLEITGHIVGRCGALEYRVQVVGTQNIHWVSIDPNAKHLEYIAVRKIS